MNVKSCVVHITGTVTTTSVGFSHMQSVLVWALGKTCAEGCYLLEHDDFFLLRDNT